jgi:hypothetical protein
MPAVEIPKLRARLGLLLTAGYEPVELARGIRRLFDLYADPTQLVTSQTPPGSPKRFNTPLILSLEVEKAIQPICLEKPLEILPVIDALWGYPEIELRQLAVRLLGGFSRDQYPEVTRRIELWSRQGLEEDLLVFLLQTATISLRKNDPESWLNTLRGWGISDQPKQVALAIRGLLPLIEDKEFQNLPLVFTFLYPFFQPFRTDLAYELEAVLSTLISRSEIETVFFVKQLMGGNQVREYGRFLRRIMGQFSPGNQVSIKNALKDHPSLS